MVVVLSDWTSECEISVVERKVMLFSFDADEGDKLVSLAEDGIVEAVE